MGICFNHKKYRLVNVLTNFDDSKSYSKNVLCKIKKRNAIGKIINFKDTFVDLQDPDFISSFKISINNKNYWISSCVVPGLNLKTSSCAKPQDSLGVFFNDDLVFIALFDAYGPDAVKLSQECLRESENFFNKNSELCKKNTEDFLGNLTQSLEKHLISCTNLDIDNSGWYFLRSSELLAVVSYNSITTANLGDTRAILASTSNNYTYGKNSLLAVQLTQEHRPDATEEYERIVLNEGRVQKLVDINGQFIGPYRVWEPNINFPGLTISRCLGSMRCKSLGVISKETLKSFAINHDKDYFLVVASDGIWEVISNIEVVNFIETYRSFCVKGLDLCTESDTVSFSNTCIAHLLCEEARARWLLKIEDENAVMDDISCVVVELKQPDSKTELVQDATVLKTNLEEAKEREARKAPTLVESSRKDLGRPSLLGISVLNSKTEM